MPRPLYPRLLGDIGGTHARLAWQADASAVLTDVARYACGDFASLEDSIRRYLADHGKTAPPACGIGIANPIIGDQVRMTNHHWSFSIEALRTGLGLERLHVINDFTALALALPSLSAQDVYPVGSGQAVTGAPLAVIGPGTGLGVSGLLPSGDGQWVAIAGEGGHVSLSAASPREGQVIEWLSRRFGHASAERALSGPGLVNLYQACCALDGQPAEMLSAPEVLARARGSDDAACTQALQLFLGLLGSVAGNLALTLGARGGVYIGGGIVPRLVDLLAGSALRERFEAKGRFQDYLRQIPLLVINTETSPALMGVSRALDGPG